MPHMMPMLWMFIFLLSFLFLFILSSMIYFFYIPNIYINNNISKNFNKLTIYKWNWMW